MDGEPIARRVVVSGRVQGVFFRDTCQRLASAAGVAGWVRNTASGDVEAWFEGERAAVHRLVAWCQDGPRGAFVTAAQVSVEEPTGGTGFRVR